MNVGMARGKHKIVAPATTGHPEFERMLRIQQNMVEQLVFFIPAVWIFSLTVSVLIGAGLGLAFVVGRVLYSASYAKDPAKRGPGFMIAGFPTIILLFGGLIGVIRLFLLDA
jgi:uncharacterized membrane protein YecN with MAPEG domain